MANETFTATQATVLATDNDAPDGVIDPGDVVTTTVTITNNSTTPRSPPPASSSPRRSTA